MRDVAVVRLYFLLLGLFALVPGGVAADFNRQSAETQQYVVQPGDTWQALGRRYDVNPDDLRMAYGHLNRYRQPAIGETISLPATGEEQTGRIGRQFDGGLLETAARYGISPWAAAIKNGQYSPYRPSLWRPLFLPAPGEIVRELPTGMTALELSQAPASPGEGLAFRGLADPNITYTAGLEGLPAVVAGVEGGRLVGLLGTGAFFGTGKPELTIRAGDGPAWRQPWLFLDKTWDFQELTLTGPAAEIDQAAIQAERERLQAIWRQVTPGALWSGAFRRPMENHLGMSATYGGRRSYNGGPVRSYHEGVDFSAYRGTPVLAPAAGTVVLAEFLNVRGGAVIVDHGLGVYTGYYHLSAVNAAPGQDVQAGDLLGEVGTTGLSTGNHLHWDLLVNGVWVDASAWLEQNTACWVLAGLGRACDEP